MVTLKVDPFPPEDAMDRLWRRAWGAAHIVPFEAILRRSLTHVGAYDQATLIGFVNVAWDGGIHAFLLDTCVDPDFRRRGIASDLVRLAAEESRRRGVHWLHVDFEPRLEGFYRACGFGPTQAGLMRLSGP